MANTTKKEEAKEKFRILCNSFDEETKTYIKVVIGDLPKFRLKKININKVS